MNEINKIKNPDLYQRYMSGDVKVLNDPNITVSTDLSELTSVDIADEIVLKACGFKSPVTVLKLNKVLYYLDVMYMLTHHSSNQRLIKSNFERWSYGPTEQNVYNEYHQNGGRLIKSTQAHLTGANYKDGVIQGFKAKLFDQDQFCSRYPEQAEFIEDHLPTLLNYDQWNLVKLSQLEKQWKDGQNHVSQYSAQSSYDFYSQYENQFWTSREVLDRMMNQTKEKS